MTILPKSLLALLPLAVALAPGCGSRYDPLTSDAGHVLPSVEAVGGERFAMTLGEESGVSVMVLDRKWGGSSHAISIQYSSIFVQVANEGDRQIRFRVDDFALESAGQNYPAIDAESVVLDAGPGTTEGRIAKTTGIRPTTLDPGESVEGFLFFRKKFKLSEQVGESLSLRVALYDAPHESLIESLELPLAIE